MNLTPPFLTRLAILEIEGGKQTWELLAAQAARFRNQTKASEEPISWVKRGKTNLVFEETYKYRAKVNILHFEVLLLNIEGTKETEAFSFAT